MLTVFATVYGNENWRQQANAAQYGESDYANAVRLERGITLEKAIQIAESDPEIAYFFITTGYTMVLTVPSQYVGNDPLKMITQTHFIYDNGTPSYGHCRIFHHGDTVFFKDIKGMWLGGAPGLADTWIRN